MVEKITDNIKKLYEITETFKTYKLKNGGSYRVMQFSWKKQFELIKWLSKRHSFGLTFGYSAEWIVMTDFADEDYETTYGHESFSQALAGLLIELWQNLSETEKSEVKGILK